MVPDVLGGIRDPVEARPPVHNSVRAVWIDDVGIRHSRPTSPDSLHVRAAPMVSPDSISIDAAGRWSPQTSPAKGLPQVDHVTNRPGKQSARSRHDDAAEAHPTKPHLRSVSAITICEKLCEFVAHAVDTANIPAETPRMCGKSQQVEIPAKNESGDVARKQSRQHQHGRPLTRGASNAGAISNVAFSSSKPRPSAKRSPR